MTEASPRRLPRVLSCLVKGPLGCLAFVLGAAVVTLLLLPPVGGRFLDRLLEEEFAAEHQGSLELGDAWFGSFYGPQTIDSLILRDPDGEDVLRASLRAPSLVTLVGRQHSRYGPVVIRVPLLRLRAEGDGQTNVTRALAAIPHELDTLVSDDSGLRLTHPFEIELQVEVARVRYTDARGEDGVLDALRFDGTLLLGPQETRLVLVGGTSAAGEGLHARLEFSRPEFGTPQPWTYTCAAEGLPGALAGILCSELAPLAAAAGRRVDELSVEQQGAQRKIHAVDEGARLELVGERDDGALVSDGLSARLVLPCADARASALLLRLLPLVSAVECLDPRAAHAFELHAGRWPATGDWHELAGELSLSLASAHAPLLPALRAWLGGDEPLTLSGLQQNAHLADGTLEYALFRVSWPRGWVEFDGTRELESGAGEFELRGERDGTALAPLHLGGAAEEPLPVAPAPPDPAPADPQLPHPPRGG
ncbi:MAG: hypothetical protein EXS08_07260 [Planctomycetes bacterium]|nr:hypothetical protein [Planctomycetota bacterium]